MKNTSIVVLFSLLLFVKYDPAQVAVRDLIVKDSLSINYPFLYKVTLRCKTTKEPVQGFYYYNYTLLSDAGNKGNIFTFDIDIKHQPNAVIYDTLGLRFADSFEEIEFRRYYPAAENLVESIGFPLLPNLDWDGLIAHNSVASFGVDTLLPPPGSDVNGFTMMSKALPGIRAFTAYPDFDVYQYYPDMEKDTTAALDSVYNLIYAYVDSMRNVVNYYGWTIGPTAPPQNFSAGSWIDTLISYKHQSVAHGWLSNGIMHENDENDNNTNEGIVKGLDRRLDKAKEALLKGDSVKARGELELFVKEVEHVYNQNKEEGERNGVPVMTSEAYALLKYNAEYLINKLPGKDERKGKDE